MDELEKFFRDVHAFKHKVVNTFSTVCTSRLFKLKFHLLDLRVEDISRFGGITAFDPSPHEQCNTSNEAVHRHTSKERATRLDEIMFGLEQMENSVLWEMSCGENKFLQVFPTKMHYA